FSSISTFSLSSFSLCSTLSTHLFILFSSSCSSSTSSCCCLLEIFSSIVACDSLTMNLSRAPL
ncbi:unnamed protein product, partial [Prunus brigantina]